MGEDRGEQRADLPESTCFSPGCWKWTLSPRSFSTSMRRSASRIEPLRASSQRWSSARLSDCAGSGCPAAAVFSRHPSSSNATCRLSATPSRNRSNASDRRAFSCSTAASGSTGNPVRAQNASRTRSHCAPGRKRRRQSSAAANPARQLSLQPVAVGADGRGNGIVRSTSMQRAAVGGSATTQATTRVNAEQASKHPTRKPTRRGNGEGCQRSGSERREHRPVPAGYWRWHVWKRGPAATREALPVAWARANGQPARVGSGRTGWRRGSYYRGGRVMSMEGRSLRWKRWRKAAGSREWPKGLSPRRRAAMPAVITCTSEGDDPSGRCRQGVSAKEAPSTQRRLQIPALLLREIRT